jgi:hypothetical protein
MIGSAGFLNEENLITPQIRIIRALDNEIDAPTIPFLFPCANCIELVVIDPIIRIKDIINIMIEIDNN